MSEVIRKDKQGRWFMDRRINGKRCFLRGDSKADVKKRFNEWLATQAAEQEKEQQGPLFDEIAQSWWEQKSKEIKHGTLICYRPAYLRCLEAFGDKPIKDIGSDEIAQFMGNLALKKYSLKTIANNKSVLVMIFNHWRFSSEWQGNKPNPVLGYKLPQGLPRSERQPPTAAQLAAVKGNLHAEFGHCAALMMYTGARLGEINALQWRDIDFKANTISITKSVSWHNNAPVVGTPKTKNAVRTVPLLAPLRDILKPLKSKQKTYVLSGSDEPLTKDLYAAKWAEFCELCGLCDVAVVNWGKSKYTRKQLKPQVTAHQFRHEFASVLYECGVGELEAQQLLGHADIATTHKIYTHVRKSQLDEAANKLNEYFTR